MKKLISFLLCSLFFVSVFAQDEDNIQLVSIKGKNQIRKIHPSTEINEMYVSLVRVNFKTKQIEEYGKTRMVFENDLVSVVSAMGDGDVIFFKCKPVDALWAKEHKLFYKQKQDTICGLARADSIVKSLETKRLERLPDETELAYKERKKQWKVDKKNKNFFITQRNTIAFKNKGNLAEIFKEIDERVGGAHYPQERFYP